MSERVTDQSTVDPSELSALGVIQEVNRRLLHPVGLALGYVGGEDVLRVWDSRDDAEGVRFEGMDLAPRRDAFDALWEQVRPEREAALGYMVQPVE